MDEQIKQALNDLLSPVDLHKVVSIEKLATGAKIMIGGEHQDPARLANLKSEAEFLLNSDLWSLLYETPKELAQRTMFVNGESIDDMKKGRSILYTLSVQQNILNMLKSYKG